MIYNFLDNAEAGTGFLDNGIRLENILYCSFDICALLLLVVVAFNYFFSKRTKNRSSSLYTTMLVMSLCASGADFLYLLTKYMVATPAWVYNTFNILFYLFYSLLGVIFLVYSVSFVYGKNIPRLRFVEANSLCCVSVIGVIMASVSLYGGFTMLGAASFEEVYEYIIYGAQLCAMMGALLVTVRYSKMLKLHHRLNVYIFLALNILSLVLQKVLSWHVTCFALAISDLLLYVTLQRPEDELDSISGMFNASSFIKRANARLAAEKPFIVFAAEVNNISIVNSSFGFKGGNEVIREVSKRIKLLLPKDVYLYRLGGVRFVVLFNNEQEYKDFERVYPGVFEEPFEIFGSKMRISATACIISIPEVTDKISDVEEIIKYYRSSAKTSDMVFVADKTVVDISRRREMVDYAVQRALKNRSFEVYYQPIYSVKDKKINSCEALIRLNDPDLGFVGPDEFIPVAEQNGRIVDVGKFVMEEVCRFLRDELPQQYGLEFVDVNLSVIQCMHSEIISDIDGILKEYGVPRKMVNLEVTETASAQSYALLQSRLNELHQSGFTISLDDFGTGFSSVEYLINFPFDVVKLDKSLVWAYMSTKKYEPILKHYMPMLHGLGTRIVAEGVETEEMVKALEELGCDYLQGYYFSRPIPKNNFLEYLKNNMYNVQSA